MNTEKDETKEMNTRAEFRALVEPVMDWMMINSHPHATVVITTTDAELLEGKIGISRLPQSQDDVFGRLGNILKQD